MEKNLKKYSCMDCRAMTCNEKDAPWPAFCLTQSTEEQIYKECKSLYFEEENSKIMKAAAEVEAAGYCRWPRAYEIVEFAKRIGATKIGIATCVGLLGEAQTFTRLLKSHGFEVYGAACKVGAVPKTEVGIDKSCCSVGNNMCNPIMQAKLLNEAGTDLNVIIGLCVGHDSLFMKYSEALTTTLVTKDRVTGHNPAAALYTLDTYYKSLMGDK